MNATIAQKTAIYEHLKIAKRNLEMAQEKAKNLCPEEFFAPILDGIKTSEGFLFEETEPTLKKQAV